MFTFFFFGLFFPWYLLYHVLLSSQIIRETWSPFNESKERNICIQDQRYLLHNTLERRGPFPQCLLRPRPLVFLKHFRVSFEIIYTRGVTELSWNKFRLFYIKNLWRLYKFYPRLSITTLSSTESFLMRDRPSNPVFWYFSLILLVSSVLFFHPGTSR